MSLYAKSNVGKISQNETNDMIKIARSYVNQSFNPTQDDMKGYHNVLDFNNDGVASSIDIENLCIKYLCGSKASQPSQPIYREDPLNKPISKSIQQ